jgi:putative transposase
MHWKRRRQRPRAYNDPGDAHELTFSCFQQYPFLSKERTCRWLAEEIDAARKELKYWLWAYVFMPDHVHLVVCPQERVYDDSDFLKRIKEPVAREAVQHLKKAAPEWLDRIRVPRGEKVEHHFWQPGRGHDRNIQQAQTLENMIEYTHMNPVRRNLVERPAQWKWSSAGWFAGRPLNDLEPDPIPRD